MEARKIAVVLFNIGGPKMSNEIKPFLYRFFSDRNIIDLPYPLRKTIAFMISRLRYKKSKSEYDKIGGGSPILKNTQEQANALEAALNMIGDGTIFKCFIGMRYTEPFVSDAVREIEQWNAEEVVLLPLYPQYSFTTTRSSFQEWDRCYEGNAQIHRINNYHVNRDFCLVYAVNIKPYINDNSVILFSAHGLPEKIINSGDPYAKEVAETTQEILKILTDEHDISNIEYEICYQSRATPVKWIEPATDDVIIKYSKMEKEIIIVPIAFVSEHLETLAELDVVYKELAHQNGAKQYIRIKALGCDDKFITCLKNLVVNIIN